MVYGESTTNNWLVTGTGFTSEKYGTLIEHSQLVRQNHNYAICAKAGIQDELEQQNNKAEKTVNDNETITRIYAYEST